MMVKRGLLLIAWMGITLGLLSLGLWQLNRAQEKQQLLSHFTHNQQADALPLDQLLPITPEQRYQKVILQGHFDNQQSFLIDNKTVQNQVGYNVITPFILNTPLSETSEASKKVILVNRGFIPRGASRAQLPSIPSVDGQQTITAIIDFPSQQPFLLGENYDASHITWPLVLQHLLLADISTILHQPVYPFTALLYDSCCGFETHTQPVAQMSPSTHHGYAVQWFGLAATWILLTTLYWRKKKKTRSP